MKTLLFLLLLIPSIASAQVQPADQWTSTSSPQSSITQRIFGKPLKLTGLNTGECLTLAANGLATTTGAACGSGAGSVTSISGSGGTTGLTLTGGPITTAGTLTLGGTLGTANGGTNLTSYTLGDLLYASATNVLARLGIGTGGQVLGVSNGLPAWVATTTFSSPLLYSDGNVTCQTATGSLDGCLSAADWTTFNNKQPAGNYITALTGDVTATGPGSVAATLATVNADIGTFNNITINEKGLATAGTNVAYLQNVVEDTTPELGGDLDANANDISNLGDITFKTGAIGGTVRTGTSNADKFELQAYDVNGGFYQKVLEADAGNTPTLEVFADSFAIWDNADESKKVNFTLSGGGTGITTNLNFTSTANRTITFPDASGTLFMLPTLTSGSVLFSNGTTIAQDNANFFWDDTNNRLGIGTASPAYKLDLIQSSGSATFRLGSDTSQYLYMDSGGVESHIYSVGVKPFYLGANSNANQLVLASGGNVGIGTTTPWGKLSVTNTGTGPSFVVEDTASPDSTPFLIDASGNVGIGNATPSSNFHLAGTIQGTSVTDPISVAVLPVDLSTVTIDNSVAGTVRRVLSGRFLTLDPTTSTSFQSMVDRPVMAITSGNAQGMTGSLFISEARFQHGGTGTLSSVFGTRHIMANTSTGIISAMSGLTTTVSQSGGGTITSFKGFDVSGITNSSGTITNLYGVYVGDITAGTQTNTPFSFYASDANAYNYFAGNVGIGTTSPYAALSVQSNSATIFSVATSTGNTVFSIDNGGHVLTSGPAPTVSSCGTSPSVVGSDKGGTITVGTGVVLSCTITFAKAYTAIPYATMTINTSGVTGGITSISTTGITFSFSATVGGGIIYYQVAQHQ